MVTQRAYSRESATLADTSAASLRRFLRILNMKVPRVLSVNSARIWFEFTDASHEPDSVPPISGLGAVLVDDTGNRLRFFSEELPSDLLGRMNLTKRKTLVFRMRVSGHFKFLQKPRW
eukprot:s5802_g1.t1